LVIQEKISAAVLWPGGLETLAGGVEVVTWIAGGVFSGGFPEFSALEDVGAGGVAGSGFVLEPSIKSLSEQKSERNPPGSRAETRSVIGVPK
jgi:hypothetical protein